MSPMALCSLLLVLFLASPVLSVPGDLYDWHTGNSQLHDAVNAALFRYKLSGDLAGLNEYYNFSYIASDPLCLIGAQEGLQVFSYPANPVGTLKNILTRGYWLVTTPGPYDEGTSGDWTADPPTGFSPDLLRALASMIGEAYGVPNLGVQYYFATSPYGFEAILNGSVDSTNDIFALTVSITLPDGSQHLRSDLLHPSCSVSVYAETVGVLPSLNVSTYDELVALVSKDPSTYTIGTTGYGGVIEAQDAFPGTTVLDYLVLFPDYFSESLLADLLNGTLDLVWNYSPEAAAPQVITLTSTTLEVEGIFFRYDSAECSGTPSATPTPVPQHQHHESGHRGTSVNFYFDGMLRQ